MRMSARGVWPLRAALLVAMLALSVGAAGCIVLEGEDVPAWLSGSVETTTVEVEAPPQSGAPAPTGSHGDGREVLMMGRSVMAGWFEHWGYDGSGPVLEDGYALYLREVSGPPDIGRDAAGAIAALPDGTIVVFKLCFVDFWAADSADVSANVEENMGYVREVEAACAARGLPLVVGNALPMVRGEMTPGRAQAHRAFNEALAAFAAEKGPDVTVLDLYGTLAGSDGSLPRGLALSPDDSHLNDVAYLELDDELFGVLAGVE